MGVAESRPTPWGSSSGREWRPAPSFDLPHPLRMRDFLLGGKDNYQADRDAVEATLAVHPDLKLASRAEEAFLRRAIAWIADPARGLTQYLHLGAFIPTLDSYDGQVRAQCPDATFVYVTDDSISAAHARAVLAAQADGPLHYGKRVQISGAAISSPPLKRAKTGHALSSRLHVDAAVADGSHKARKAIDTVCVHAVARCLCKQPCTRLRPFAGHAKANEHAGKRSLHFIEGKSIH